MICRPYGHLRVVSRLHRRGRRSFDKLAGLVGAKLVSGCAVSVQMTDESASSGGNDEGLCLMRDGDTYEVPVGLEEYDCAGLTCKKNTATCISFRVGGFDPGCKLPRAHLMAGIDDNVQSSAPGVACKYG